MLLHINYFDREKQGLAASSTNKVKILAEGKTLEVGEDPETNMWEHIAILVSSAQER